MKKQLLRAFAGWLLCLSAMTMLCTQTSYAQQPGTGKVTVKGKVANERGELVVGATVLGMVSRTAITTDKDGNYVVTVNENESLRFSFIGYAPLEVTVGGRTVIDVVLSEEAQDVDEVIVVGYSSIKKSELTGAVSSVKMSDIETRHVSNILDGLQGQIPGVQITRANGSPSSDFQVLIRGQGTFNDTNPLYIVDGVPTTSIKFLNPSDIESMSILKDAAASAMYGARAANGVVVITTKSGKVGTTNINIEYYEGVSTAANLPKMLNGTQYMDVMETMWSNSSRNDGIKINPYTKQRQENPYLANTDWLDEIFETGRSRDLMVSANGGSEKVDYFISGGYTYQDGIYRYANDTYQRFSFRSNVVSKGHFGGRLNIGGNVQLSYEDQDWPRADGGDDGSRGEGVTRLAFFRPPVIPVTKDVNDPTYSAEDPFTDLPFYVDNSGAGTGWNDLYGIGQNPVATLYFTDDKNSSFRTFGNAFVDFAFLKDKSLIFKSNVGINLVYGHNKRWMTPYGDDDGTGTPEDRAYGTGRHNKGGGVSENRSQSFDFTWTNTLRYNKTFGRHGISALVGSEFINNYYSDISGSRSRYNYTSPEFHYLGSGTVATSYVDGGASEFALMSLFASLTYSYDARYFATANIRADESSRFAASQRWGYFPSISAGWNISQEKFMQPVSSISDLRLRLSYGTLGNQNIGNYGYTTTIKKVQDKYVVARYGNPDIHWETTSQANIGIDMGFFSNKLYLTADLFDKTTDGILLGVSLPSFVGAVDPTYVNAAKVRNRGVEVAITHRNTVGEFSYSVSANAAFIKNKVLALHPTVPSMGTEVVTRPGEPINYFFGYEMEGIYQTEEEILQQQYATDDILDKPGDIRFRDLNQDGVINEADRKIIGKPNPDLTYGLNGSLRYKGFSFAFFFQGVAGVERVNSVENLNLNSREYNKTTAVLESWHGPGTSNTHPRLSFDDIGVGRHPFSTAIVKDASYLRLKNVEIAYSFAKFVNRLRMSDLTLFVSGQNLLTFTEWTGIDPEVVGTSDPMNYPNSRVYQMGLKLKF